METIGKLPGRKLRELREARSLSRDVLAERVESTGSTIYRVERGEVWLTADLLGRLCAYLKVSPAYFYDDGAPAVREKPTLLRALTDALAALRGLTPAALDLVGLLPTLDDDQIRHYASLIRTEVAAQSGMLEPESTDKPAKKG